MLDKVTEARLDNQGFAVGFGVAVSLMLLIFLSVSSLAHAYLWPFPWVLAGVVSPCSLLVVKPVWKKYVVKMRDRICAQRGHNLRTFTTKLGKKAHVCVVCSYLEIEP